MADTTVAFCQLLRFLNGAASYIPLRDYQNFWINETYAYSGVSYLFAPFRLAGASTTRGADISESQIITVPNPITVGVIAEAVRQRWLVETKTCLVSTPSTPTDTPTFSISQVLTTQLWSTNGMTQDTDTLTLGLTSPLNLTDAQIPRRVLTSDLVGPLPATGNIYAR